MDEPGTNYPKKVYPDARVADSDGDGLSDAMEFAKLTDPRVREVYLGKKGHHG